MQEISAFFYFPFWMKVFRLFRWILYRIVFNQIHVCQLFLDSIKDDIVYLCLKKKKIAHKSSRMLNQEISTSFSKVNLTVQLHTGLWHLTVCYLAN